MSALRELRPDEVIKVSIVEFSMSGLPTVHWCECMECGWKGGSDGVTKARAIKLARSHRCKVKA